MKKLNFYLLTLLLSVFFACGEKKTESATAPATEPVSATATAAPVTVDTVAKAIDDATKELEENSANMKKALDELK